MEPVAQDYDVIYAETIETLKRLVKSKLKEGWHLHGPMVVAGRNFYQPMVLY